MSGFVDGLGVVRAVCREGRDGISDLLKQGRDLGTVMRPANGQIRCDDLTRITINSKVQLPPSPVPGRFLHVTDVDPEPVLSMSRWIGRSVAAMQVMDYTPGGDRLLVMVAEALSDLNVDLYVTDLDGGNPVPYLRTEWNELDSRLTPDGKWAAYVSNQTGGVRVFVRSFPDPGLATPVSAGPGQNPRWSPDGRTLYYSTRDSIFAASMTFDSGATVASRTSILSLETEQGRIIDWDVYPQGGFVAIIQPPTPAAEPGDAEPAQNVPYRTYFVVNWVQEMLKRVGG